MLDCIYWELAQMIYRMREAFDRAAGTWSYLPTAGVQEVANLLPLGGGYLENHLSRVADYTAPRPILWPCLEEVRREWVRESRRWWEQRGTKKEGRGRRGGGGQDNKTKAGNHVECT